MRTGSNNICALLNNSDNIIYNTEDFNGKLIRTMKPRIKKHILNLLGIQENELAHFCSRSPLEYFDILSSYDPNRHMLIKIFEDHLKHDKQIDIFTKGKNIIKIVLTRDLLEVFVSLKIAYKTGHWFMHDTSNVQITVNFGEFEIFYSNSKKYYNMLKKYSDDQTIWIDYSEIVGLTGFEQYIFLQKRLTNLVTLSDCTHPKSIFFKQSHSKLKESVINYDEIYEKYSALKERTTSV